MARKYVREVIENLEAWLDGEISQEDFEAERDRITSTLPDGSTVQGQESAEMSNAYEYA